MVYKKVAYDWKTPIFSKVSAQTAGEHMEELEEKFGEVTPQILLEDSRPDDAVLHPLYEWDDPKAAERWRLHQSKMIMGNLIVVSVNKKALQEPVRAFFTVSSGNEQGSYNHICTIVSNEDKKKQVLSNAMRELDMFNRKYQNLLDVTDVLTQFVRKLKTP